MKRFVIEDKKRELVRNVNEKKSREILEVRIGSIMMSVDSLKKEVFEKIRVRLNFEEVRDID